MSGFTNPFNTNPDTYTSHRSKYCIDCFHYQVVFYATNIEKEPKIAKPHKNEEQSVRNLGTLGGLEFHFLRGGMAQQTMGGGVCSLSCAM